MKNIRNFSIIAHIDHGKSTLSDRLIEITKTVTKREMKAQLLDSMDIERERGITIKMQAVRLNYQAPDHQTYQLNLIDTPGHVDFSYEVSRSLAACEGVVLVVDAAQGIEAQTLANFYLALEHDLDIIPVINKIDLPSADVPKVQEEIERVLGIPPEETIACSAKTGEGVEAILKAIVKSIKPPIKESQPQLKALIYDALYDEYRGVVAYIRVMSGEIKKGEKIKMMASDQFYDVLEVGCFKPTMTKLESLKEGEVGYLIANIKTISDARIGDTVTHKMKPAMKPLSGYKEVKPMVFSGLYPVDTNQYLDLKEALAKLKLNDAALQYDKESSQALGFGFRCGFLGLLHMEITQERIQREFNIEIVVTAPNVTFQISTTKEQDIKIENPSQFPEPNQIEVMKEPLMGLAIVTPNSYMGTVTELVKNHRGHFKKAETLDANRQMITFEIPLNELITTFFDHLKSLTKGYASMDYWFERYVETDLVKVNILINGEPVDALSFISHRSKSTNTGRKIVEKLKEIIPRQLYEIAVQASVGANVICRESIKALRKNVTARCYGGDISRKRKLLEKQKEGKKRMKQVGSVQIPKDAFLSILKIE